MVEDVHTLNDLRRFIRSALCQKENLLSDQYQITEMQLTRNARPCGLQFCLRGPRSVRLSAIWVEDQNTVYLYDAQGARYGKLRLTHRIGSQCHAPAA